MRNKLLLLSMIWAIGACVPKTEFHGDPRVPNGRAGCEQVCSTYGMALAGMVAMGDNYTDGCICMVPDMPSTAMVTTVAAVAPAAAGVIMQTRADEEEEERRRREAANN